LKGLYKNLFMLIILLKK